MHYKDNSDQNILESNEVDLVITTNEKKIMMPHSNFEAFKQSLKTLNGDIVTFTDDRF